MSPAEAVYDFLYPDVDGWRSCSGCGAIPCRGHAAINHTPLVPCPVEQLEGKVEQLQATRDRLADLEVYAAELHDLLNELFYRGGSGVLDRKIRTALQTEPPARGRAILDQVERLRKVTEACPSSERLRLLADWLDLHDNDRRYRGPREVQDDLRKFADAVDALDLGAAQEEDRGG